MYNQPFKSLHRHRHSYQQSEQLLRKASHSCRHWVSQRTGADKTEELLHLNTLSEERNGWPSHFFNGFWG